MMTDIIITALALLAAASPLILRLATLLQPILVLWMFPDVKRVRTGSILGYSEIERPRSNDAPPAPPAAGTDDKRRRPRCRFLSFWRRWREKRRKERGS